ncbi:Uncharacterised protein [Mycobacteroides abscessus]|nr:Uncharacterised protein [Mycobacteroides abscessus]
MDVLKRQKDARIHEDYARRFGPRSGDGYSSSGPI